MRKRRNIRGTRRDAVVVERELRAAVSTGTYQERGVPTLASFVDEYLTIFAAQHNKPRSVTSKRSRLKRVTGELGHVRLDAIDARAGARLIARLSADGLEPNTVRVCVAALRHVLSVAVEWGYLDAAPRLPTVRREVREVVALTDAETSAVLGASWGRWTAMIALGLDTGLRISEMRALRWCDVDAELSQITVNHSGGLKGELLSTKSGKCRVVPLPSRATETLRAHREVEPGIAGAFLFKTRVGSMIPLSNCSKVMGKISRAAGTPSGWHILRHTYASRLIQRGATLRVVQELLGHASITETMRYAHLTPQHTRAAVALLETK